MIRFTLVFCGILTSALAQIMLKKFYGLQFLKD